MITMLNRIFGTKPPLNFITEGLYISKIHEGIDSLDGKKRLDYFQNKRGL